MNWFTCILALAKKRHQRGSKTKTGRDQFTRLYDQMREDENKIKGEKMMRVGSVFGASWEVMGAP